MRIKGALLSVGLGLLCAAAGTASANPLPVSAGVTPDAFGAITGTVVAHVGNSYALKDAGGNTVGTGTYDEWVLSGDSSNALGGLDFIFQVHPTTGNMETVTTTGYTGLLVDGGVATTLNGNSAGTNIPLFMSRDDEGVVGFHFAPALHPPAVQTEYLTLQTNSNNYSRGFINIIDGGVASVAGFTPVPAPASVWGGLGLLGTLGAAVLRRRARLA